VTLAVIWKIQITVLPMVLELYNKHTSIQLKYPVLY